MSNDALKNALRYAEENGHQETAKLLIALTGAASLDSVPDEEVESLTARLKGLPEDPRLRAEQQASSPAQAQKSLASTLNHMARRLFGKKPTRAKPPPQTLDATAILANFNTHKFKR